MSMLIEKTCKCRTYVDVNGSSKCRLDMVDSCAPPYLRQAGGGKHEERAQDLHSRQSARGQVVTHHLAPAITDFILDENQKCCDNKLEQALTLLHSPRSKEIKTSRQTSTHHPHIFGTQSTRKVQNSCVETCRGKCPRYQQLHMILTSFLNKRRL